MRKKEKNNEGRREGRREKLLRLLQRDIKIVKNAIKVTSRLPN